MDSDLKKISNTSFTIFVNKGKILTDIFYVINMKKKKEHLIQEKRMKSCKFIEDV